MEGGGAVEPLRGRWQIRGRWQGGREVAGERWEVGGSTLTHDVDQNTSTPVGGRAQ